MYAISILIKFERFDSVNYLLSQQYYDPSNAEYGRDVMVGVASICNHLESFDYRNRRLGLRRLSLRAELIKNRCAGSGLEFVQLMQADFVIFMYVEINRKNDYESWWPHTLVYLEDYFGPFAIFARSGSAKYFDKAKMILGINSSDDLDQLFDAYKTGARKLPSWDYHHFSPQRLLNFDKLAKAP
ncbi:hypothetical protein [Desulfolutivibrio sulfoxidireducens]|uniref:hypothetical protein n=1 Tax=Desulfolutivibrio sulfoxidireducens TaxID=2773299 RepID=UPI00159E9589|nr:hypothetical protein [Desulfolutivibrio sulfoxidireducens]QLA17655.1 hypothetical protein GD605_17015 [Desulfolutivibrio sulfoxidireducens]